MKFPGLDMPKPTKQKFIAGITAGLIFYMEEAARELIPEYPPELQNKINPSLPRNGQLLATIAPLGTAWVAPKITKKHGETMHNIKMGVTMYDAPKLIQQIVVNAAYSMGTPTQRITAPLRINNISQPARTTPAPAARVTTGSKYRLTA